MALIQPFDPWRSKLCTCPPKYSFNPYTGCAHGCIYCYASAYIPHFRECRPKLDLIRKVIKEAGKIPPNSLISMSNTSDPYPPMEKERGNTRRCLEIFQAHDFRVLIITKSDLVAKDIDILANMRSAVTITITSLKFFAKLEPNAPSPFLRFQALRKLKEAGVPVGLRLDPIFPHLNEDEIEEIVSKAASLGVSHIVSSTFKPRWDSWGRFQKSFPEIAKETYHLYFELGQKVGNSWYLPRELRLNLMLRVKKSCENQGLTFACCREGFKELHTAKSCDGSHLIK